MTEVVVNLLKIGSLCQRTNHRKLKYEIVRNIIWLIKANVSIKNLLANLDEFNRFDLER